MQPAGVGSRRSRQVEVQHWVTVDRISAHGPVHRSWSNTSSTVHKAGAVGAPRDPPEGWLLKAYEDGVLIDLIFEPQDGPIDDGTFERAEELEVHAMRMKVAALEDVFVQKLLALREQEPDFSSLLELARALREQVDWDEVRERTGESPFAKAYFILLDELEIVPGS